MGIRLERALKYKDDYRYPFACDFYIPEKDLFIQSSWTHGKRPYHEPFDENNSKHVNVLEEWKNKAKKKAFYNSAIKTWTISDVKKRKTAKEINYLEIFKLSELECYLSKLNGVSK